MTSWVSLTSCSAADPAFRGPTRLSVPCNDTCSRQRPPPSFSPRGPMEVWAHYWSLGCVVFDPAVGEMLPIVSDPTRESAWIIRPPISLDSFRPLTTAQVASGGLASSKLLVVGGAGRIPLNQQSLKHHHPGSVSGSHPSCVANYRIPDSITWVRMERFPNR